MSFTPVPGTTFLPQQTHRTTVITVPSRTRPRTARLRRSHSMVCGHCCSCSLLLTRSRAPPPATRVTVFGMLANTTGHQMKTRFSLDQRLPEYYEPPDNITRPQYRVKFWTSPTTDLYQHALRVENNGDQFWLDFVAVEVPSSKVESSTSSTSTSASSSSGSFTGIVLAGPYALDRRHIRCFVVTSVCAFQCLRALSSCFVPAARRVILSHDSNAILPACPLIPLLLSIPAPRRVVLLSNGRGSSPSSLPLLIISRLSQGHHNFISRRPRVTSRRLLTLVRHTSMYGQRMSARH